MVPKLNLAPKLKRPLSLWNPLDYLRLLYWVFYFPQALRWYENEFCGGYIPEEEMNWGKGWKLLRQSTIRRQLLLQGLFLTVFIPWIMCNLLEQIGFTIDWFGVALGVALGVAFGVALGVAIFRLDNWLLAVPVNWHKLQNGSWLFPRITPIPLPNIASKLKNWLGQDWETGLENINQLLQYSKQFIPVINAVNELLAATSSERVIFRVVQLAENPFDWDLVRFSSASLGETMKSSAVKGIFWLPPAGKRKIQAGWPTEPRLDTPPRAAAAGFWYWHELKPQKAREAFARVKTLLYGEEMFLLAEIMADCHQAENQSTIAKLQLPHFPQENLLRPHTWKALIGLRRVVEEVKLIEKSFSQSTKSLALNRGIGELTEILQQEETLPQAERKLIITIAENWKQTLENIAKDIGNITILKPVNNPYVVGDPVQGSLFAGREDIMRQLEELWLQNNKLQSVVLFGHRRMGKTSILLNAANCLQQRVKVAYINLLNLGEIQGVAEVFMAISDEIATTTNMDTPHDSDFLQLPYRTFARFLKGVIAELDKIDGGLIIALDEFEEIETLIEKGSISPDLMKFLRGMVQMSGKIAFAFAGLHTLEEMTEDYFHPFYASVLPLKVSFLELAATRQILANPGDDFLLDYRGDALDLIYQLTAGQPYLVQLIGFQLVRRYNDLVFQQLSSREPFFEVEDVEAVVRDREFFGRGRYYFNGVWEQAARGAKGQQEIIRKLAGFKDGLSGEKLMSAVGLEESSFAAAIEVLLRHDVVKRTESGYEIVVELFRRWAKQ